MDCEWLLESPYKGNLSFCSFLFLFFKGTLHSEFGLFEDTWNGLNLNFLVSSNLTKIKDLRMIFKMIGQDFCIFFSHKNHLSLSLSLSLSLLIFNFFILNIKTFPNQTRELAMKKYKKENFLIKLS